MRLRAAVPDGNVSHPFVPCLPASLAVVQLWYKGNRDNNPIFHCKQRNKSKMWGLHCFLFLPPPLPQILKAHDLMLKHIIIVHRPTALRKALIFNEHFPNDKRAGLIKASNYISCRKNTEK